MSYLNMIKRWFGIGTNDSMFERQSEAVVTEFQEITNNPEVDEYIEAQLVSVERIAEEGMFHTYSVARLDFDLGKYGTYPVELALPRFPDEESEIEQFMDRLGFSVNELPKLEEGDFTVPFVRVDGEWHIDWEDVRTQEVEE